mmetsp:Transcript_28627/g.91372  ORF Transcript_28627/g.91372 Transcript_28627/m.91372 type:complete len:234 (+) Transcript_28627:691-1392(+)
MWRRSDRERQLPPTAMSVNCAATAGPSIASQIAREPMHASRNRAPAVARTCGISDSRSPQSLAGPPAVQKALNARGSVKSAARAPIGQIAISGTGRDRADEAARRARRAESAPPPVYAGAAAAAAPAPARARARAPAQMARCRATWPAAPTAQTRARCARVVRSASTGGWCRTRRWRPPRRAPWPQPRAHLPARPHRRRCPPRREPRQAPPPPLPARRSRRPPPRPLACFAWR